MSLEGKVRFIGAVESANEVSKIKIFPTYLKGLRNVDQFSHLIVLYWLSLRDNEDERRILSVIPRKHPGAPSMGVFATRSPSRPNPIGLCVVRLLKVEDHGLLVEGLDALEGTPIVDIKPYIPRVDAVPDAAVPEWTSHGPET